MQRLGLTGSVGMGKSFVAACFAELGIPAFNADAAIHALLAPGGAAVDEVAAAFPEAHHNNAIDRKALGEVVFNDPVKLRALEDILYPHLHIEEERFTQEAAASGASFAVYDIPLLFEKDRAAEFDRVLVVTAPPEVQKTRVLARSNMDEARFTAILAQQLPDAEKRARADHVINTDQQREKILAELQQIMENYAQ